MVGSQSSIHRAAHHVPRLWIGVALSMRMFSSYTIQGRIQDFKLGGAHFKKIAPSGGRREKCWGISCEKSRFYAKQTKFFQLRREARKVLGIVWKITILRQKILFFPILGGARAGCPPPGSAPAYKRGDLYCGRHFSNILLLKSFLISGVCGLWWWWSYKTEQWLKWPY